MTYLVDAFKAGQVDELQIIPNPVLGAYLFGPQALGFSWIRIASPAETARQYIELDCGHRTSNFVTRIAHFQLELPSFKRHQHASEFVPLDAATIYDDAWPT
jgi:hypothetical protein